MRFMTIISSLLLSGCFFNNLKGAWEGTCEFDGYYEMDIEMEIEEDSGGDVEGEVDISFQYDGVTIELSGDVEGERAGSDVSLTFDFGSDGEVDIEATLSGEELEGECSSGGLSGILGELSGFCGARQSSQRFKSIEII